MVHEGQAPSRQEIAAIAARVERRMLRWLRRRDLVDERPAEDRSNEAHEPTPLEACMQMSLFGGANLRLAEDGSLCRSTTTLLGRGARARGRRR